MEGAGVFGSAKAGVPFNVVEFLKRPQVILRFVSILISIIVFGCISSGGRTHSGACIFRGDSHACGFATAIGVLAFLDAIIMLVCDYKIESIANIKTRRHLVLGDLAFSGVWTFLWFVTFCYLTHAWINTQETWLKSHKVTGFQENNARASVVFSLVSIGIWAGITFCALKRFLAGQQVFGNEPTASTGPPPPMSGMETGSAGYQPQGYTGGVPGQQGTMGGDQTGDQYYPSTY